MISYQPTPIVRIELPEANRAGVHLWIKREDLNHPFATGNKWWKLKYNLDQAKRAGHATLLTFGGAYSNHIFATAAAAAEAGFQSIGVIRGEDVEPRNPTLQFATECGMRLHFITRTDYRRKDHAVMTRDLRDRFGDFYLIPEGGSNQDGVRGCVEFAHMLTREAEFDHLILPVGTGATMAGLICGLEGAKHITGISVLRNGGFLNEDISAFARNYSGADYGNWQLLTSYDHGGYARVTDELLRFIVMMQDRHNLPLDPVYTGKMMWAVAREIERGHFARGSTVLLIHTGGLQGRGSVAGISQA
ncbi:MAG TPA: pyridoxal-phosphate dependent enzyme [Chryseosolibacter sp.]|nr:pyridoxal-phosphate dependent enzyme [Chryseosolibacter sp.]